MEVAKVGPPAVPVASPASRAIRAVVFRTSYNRVMASPGEWVRQEARREQLEIVKRFRWHLALLGLIVGVPGIAVLVFVGGTMAGLTVGLAWASAWWATVMIVVQVSGAAPRLMGADAEAWTADELRALPATWRFLHGLRLEKRDVDHVVVGPAGVFAIETKWTASKKPDRLIEDAVHQAREGARGARLRLRAHYGTVDVVPVLVLWGSHTRRSAPEAVRDTMVVHGSQLVSWLQEQPAGVLTSDEIAGCYEGLVTYTRRRASGDTSVSRFEEVGVTGVVNDVLFGVAAGIATIGGVAALWTQVVAPGAATATGLVAAAALAARARWPRSRSIALGVAAGAVGTLGLFSILYAADVARRL